MIEKDLKKMKSNELDKALIGRGWCLGLSPVVLVSGVAFALTDQSVAWKTYFVLSH